MDDRRVFERFPSRLLARLLDIQANLELKASTADLSAKGVGLETSQELLMGAPLELWLEMPDKGEPLYLRGKVVWSLRHKPQAWRAGIELEKAQLMGLSRALR